ncbi:APC family permease [Streptosporangium lutulentum]|uniref:APA family basic amino acid/polyamine antiporter n=1 Tax=Streptosporangium lutulentum TaxID=1461250 RepID=A0ABT9QMK8_9ACTN|nr:amino acid permease [Streptosporangium lutulentum]MDP9847960.1 APA family basic amino acid/polyamine antiporter [Streptosporangium lutulentum]
MPPSHATDRWTSARHGLPKAYGSTDLIVLGVGVMIGAGIFSLAGRQAATMAGPGVILSFMIAGITSLLVAFCFAELASAMPTSGSAYTFTYVIFGEVWAWIVGWALLLELLLAVATVARAWSLYAAQMLTDLGVSLSGPLTGMVGKEEGFDLFALFILVALTAVVALGARIGLRALWIIVIAKLLAVGAVIVIGATHFDQRNLAAIPVPATPATGDADTLHSPLLGIVFGQTGAFGWFGIFAASAAITFAYIGFDVVATAAEESEDAPRSIPKGIIRGLILTTVVYIAVALVMVGMTPYNKIDPSAPLANAFRQAGEGFMVHIINIGAVLGLTTVILVLLVGLTRVMFSMARDGLIPRSLSTINRSYHSPTRVTLLIGGLAILLAEFVPVLTLEPLVVIGALFVFVTVAGGVIRMRRTMPDLPRGFRTPLSPGVPIASIAACLWLMVNLQVVTWLYFIIWMSFGVLVYLMYGRRNSVLAGARPVAELPAVVPPDSGFRGRHRR